MVVREERQALCGELARFAEGEFAFAELKERLARFAAARDDTVACTSVYVSEMYEEFCESAACIDREHWDELQRLILYLESDLETREPEIRAGWDAGNAVALPVAAAVAWNWLTIGSPAVYLACLGGTLLALLFRIVYTRRMRRENPKYMDSNRFAPFESPAELLRTRRKITGFRKKAYPSEAGRGFRQETGGRGGLAAALMLLLLILLFLCLTGAWPFVLLLLCFPMWTDLYQPSASDGDWGCFVMGGA